MKTPLESTIACVSHEQERLSEVANCFIYLAALAERRRKGTSWLFDILSDELPRECGDEDATLIHGAVIDFMEKCPDHPNVRSCIRILTDLRASDDVGPYLIGKLRQYVEQGDALTAFQICVCIEDMGYAVFTDENGAVVQSRSYNEAEKNLEYARRFLKQQMANHGHEGTSDPGRQTD